MKKFLILSCLLAITLTGCGGDSMHSEDDHHGHHDEQESHIEKELSSVDSEGPLQIMASFYPLAHFAEQVGGDRVEVTNLTPVGGEPHDYEPSPRELASIQESDLFLFMGAGLEPWAEDVEIVLRDVNSLEMSTKIELKEHKEEEEHEEDHDDHHEEEEDDHGHHHDHGDYDPHVWLDPTLVQEQVEAIRDTLKAIDPDHASEYDQGATAYIAELKSLDADFTSDLSNCSLDKAVVSHDAFSYLGDRYGIRFHAISGLSPQSEPSAKHLAELTDLAQDEGIKHIFFETLVSPKLAQTIASEIGAETLVLNPLEGLTSDQLEGGATYLSVMRENLGNLKTALQCQ